MSGAVALVTGAGSGIGAACVEQLSQEGWRIAALDVQPEGLTEAADRFDALPITADVTDPGEVTAALERAGEELGPIELVVNVAGISGSEQAMECHVTPPEEWERVFAVNVRGSFLVCHGALPGMLERGFGVIVNIASVAGIVPFPARCAYSASKGAVIAFTRSLAGDYAARGIRANAICPGLVETPMTSWRLNDPRLGPQAIARIPQGRAGRPEEVADAVCFLAGDRAGYVNGSVIVIDGAWTAA